MADATTPLTQPVGRGVGRSAWDRRRTLALALAIGCLILAGCGADDERPGAADLPPCPAAGDVLPGVRTGEAPWPPELEHLGERLDRIGLERLTQEGVALDLHIQLSVQVEGTDVEVPSSIGLNGEEVAGGRMVSGFVSAIHTHDATGLVHVHSPDVRPYTLGQLFDVWGVRLTPERLGGYCVGDGHTLTIEADGDPVTGNPRELQLKDRQRISVVYGDE